MVGDEGSIDDELGFSKGYYLIVSCVPLHVKLSGLLEPCCYAIIYYGFVRNVSAGSVL